MTPFLYSVILLLWNNIDIQTPERVNFKRNEKKKCRGNLVKVFLLENFLASCGILMPLYFFFFNLIVVYQCIINSLLTGLHRTRFGQVSKGLVKSYEIQQILLYLDKLSLKNSVD